MEEILIIGAGAAGVSAAVTLAKNGKKVILVSQMPSERSQSIMAEGGINAALGDGDSAQFRRQKSKTDSLTGFSAILRVLC